MGPRILRAIENSGIAAYLKFDVAGNIIYSWPMKNKDGAWFEYRKKNSIIWHRYNFLQPKGTQIAIPKLMEIFREIGAVEMKYGDLHFHKHPETGHWSGGKLRQ